MFLLSDLHPCVAFANRVFEEGWDYGFKKRKIVLHYTRFEFIRKQSYKLAMHKQFIFDCYFHKEIAFFSFTQDIVDPQRLCLIRRIKTCGYLTSPEIQWRSEITPVDIQEKSVTCWSDWLSII